MGYLFLGNCVSGQCQLLAGGRPCQSGSECASSRCDFFCTGSFCSAIGSCKAINDGAPCLQNSDCTSNNCGLIVLANGAYSFQCIPKPITPPGDGPAPSPDSHSSRRRRQALCPSPLQYCPYSSSSGSGAIRSTQRNLNYLPRDVSLFSRRRQHALDQDIRADTRTRPIYSLTVHRSSCP